MTTAPGADVIAMNRLLLSGSRPAQLICDMKDLWALRVFVPSSARRWICTGGYAAAASARGS